MRFVVAVVFSVALLIPVRAHAQDGGARVHDGFYLRLLVGPAYMHTRTKIDGNAGADPTISGFGIGGIVMAGGTPVEGLVVGGGAMGSHIVSPTVEVGPVETDSDADSILLTLGPFIDYYPDPTKGLHFVGLVGLATMEEGEDDTDRVAVGVGGVVGAGYDFWVADEWSIGAMARLQVQWTATQAEIGPVELDVRHTTVLPVVMFTALYH